MKRRFVLTLVLLLMIPTVLSSCACEHEWREADCLLPKTCTLCEEIEGEPLGHTYADATCVLPMTCTRCAATEGQALGHTYTDATCLLPMTCTRCDGTNGEPLGHDYADATCVLPMTCTRCAATDGEPLGHTYTETVVLRATSTQKGTKNFLCTVCEETHDEEYEATILTAEEIYALGEKSVGEIKTYRKNGSGLSLGSVFVISEDGRLLTNYHVIENAYSAIVKLGNLEYSVSKILSYDKEKDIAVLQISGTGFSPLYLQKEGIHGGSTVYALGSSEGYTLSFSTGVVASPDREIDGVHYIQHEAAISHGNSGGPLFNAYGEVIGINTMTNIEGQNLNFAITCAELNDLVYDRTLTLSAFYELECNPFSRLRDYVVEHGEYSAKNNNYEVYFKKRYSSDYSTSYQPSVQYDMDDNEIIFWIYIDGKYLNWLTGISFEEDRDSYYWSYIDSTDDYMIGIFYPHLFSASSSSLTYTNTNASYSAISSTKSLASTAISRMLGYLRGDLAAIGIDITDLGFPQ